MSQDLVLQVRDLNVWYRPSRDHRAQKAPAGAP